MDLPNRAASRMFGGEDDVEVAMILYGASMSPFVRKVMAVLDHKAVAYKLVGLHKDPEAFSACSPFRKMPAIDDDGYQLADSSAICAYIDAKYPQARVIPDDAAARGRVIWWDEFADTVLGGVGLTIFFNRIAAPYIFHRPHKPEAADKAEQDALPPVLAYLEEALAASAWLVGDALSLADIAVASMLINIHHAGVDFSAGRPGLARFAETMFALPTFSESIARERAFLIKTTDNLYGTLSLTSSR